MAYAAKRMFQGQLTATLTTVLATTTALKTWIIKDITLCNTDTVVRAVTLRMPGSAAGAEIFNAMPIQPNETIPWSGHIVLVAGETITGGADVASKVAISISGVEG